MSGTAGTPGTPGAAATGAAPGNADPGASAGGTGASNGTNGHAAPSLLSGGNGTGGGTAAPGTASGDDRAWLPQEYRADPTFADLRSIDNLAKSYKHAASLVGVDRAQVVRVPRDEAAPEWQEVYNRLGRPEQPDGYGLKGPDGLPAETLQDFAKTVHGAGLSKAQAAKIMDWYGTQAAAIQQAEQQQSAARLAGTEQALKREWGAAFDDQLHAARRAVREYGGDELVATLEKTGLGNDPAIIRMFAKLGMRTAEPTGLRGGNGSSDFRGALTPDAAQREIQALSGDKEFFKNFSDRSAPGYKAAKDRWERLHQFAYPGEGA